MKAKTKRHLKRVPALAKRHLRTAHSVTKRHLKRAVHTLTRKKVFRKKKTARTVLRSFLIGLATLSVGSLAYAITMNKPTVSVAVKNGSSLEIKAEPSAVPKPVFVNNGNVGKASWYALGLPAPDSLTCASRIYPRGSFLHVRNLSNQRTVICRVNDYGPEAWTGRIIDLSRGSFRQIDDLSRGVTMVEVKQVAGPTGTQLNLPIESEIFTAVVGYNQCKTQHTAEYCDSHRQD
ncbi:MAG: rare lipoprotein [Candidatus Saccharibacteria bacterium]|nr:rare lipoprotein [Candidatus Saccharibacteria bacterium]